MTNVPFADIAEFRDIETLRYYDEQVNRHGAAPAEVLEVLRHRSRDNARTPMQWSAAPEAGFTTGTPWIPVNPNHVAINAEQQRTDPDSVYHHYRRLIRLRHEDEVVVLGDCTLLDVGGESTYAFTRSLDGRLLTVLANLSSTAVPLAGPDLGPIVLANRAVARCEPGTLGPWEARVHRGRTAPPTERVQ